MAKKKAKTVKKQPKVVKRSKDAELEQPPVELTEEQIEQAMIDNDVFQNTFIEILAGSRKFEVIPTQDEHGNIMSQEQLSFMKKEVNRLGCVTVWAFENGSRFTILICPRDKKKFIVGMVSNGAEVH